MTTLYATDLDGTLLGPDARLSQPTTDMLRQLISGGTLVTFITARTPATIMPILRPAGMQLPGVAMTGATIFNPATDTYECVHYFRPEDVRAINRALASTGLNAFAITLPKGSNRLELYHPGKMLTPIERQYVLDRLTTPYKHFTLAQWQPVESHTSTVLYFAMGGPENIQQAADAINSSTHAFASPYPDTYHPGVALLEVFPRGVSKANGLMLLKERLGADRVVAFGDNLNDLPMMQVADVAVAVDNAHPSVKEAADLVIGANTSDAVPRFIFQDLQQNHNL